MAVVDVTGPVVKLAERTFFSISGELADLPRERLTRRHSEVLTYWNRQRTDGSAPRRSLIDPCAMPQALPHLMLWDVENEAGYRCRLAGTAIDATLGHLTGRRLSDIRCTLIDEARSEFDAVRDRGRISFAERTLGWIGKPHVYYRHLLLPLRGGADEISVLLGVVTFHSISERLSDC